MSSPADDERRFLHELEDGVEQELTEVQASEPAEDSAGIPTEAWLADPYLPRYEAGLRALLGAVEGVIGNDGVDGQSAPTGTPPQELRPEEPPAATPPAELDG